MNTATAAKSPPDVGYNSDDRILFDRVINDVRAFDDRGCLFRVSAATDGDGKPQDRPRSTSELVVPLPFDNDPLPAVKYLLCGLVERMHRHERSQPDFSLADFPVPVPLPIDVPYDGPLDIPRQIGAGLDGLAAGLGGRELVRGDVLRNAVHFFPEKLCLVVWSHRSTRLRYGPADAGEAARIGQLRRYVHRHESAGRRPQVLFLASDLHHARAVTDCWTRE